MITLDAQIESKLRQVLGPDLDEITTEVLVAEAYRQGKLSVGQVARLLKRSINDAYLFLKERRIPVTYSLSDFESDCEGLRELRNEPG